MRGRRDDVHRRNQPYKCGVIYFTHRSVGQTVDQPPQLEQIGEPERAPASRHRHERAWLGRIGPAHRQRELPALRVEEEHPILRPRLPHGQEHELSPDPRVERVSHPNSSLTSDWIERS